MKIRMMLVAALAAGTFLGVMVPESHAAEAGYSACRKSRGVVKFLRDTRGQTLVFHGDELGQGLSFEIFASTPGANGKRKTFSVVEGLDTKKKSAKCVSDMVGRDLLFSFKEEKTKDISDGIYQTMPTQGLASICTFHKKLVTIMRETYGLVSIARGHVKQENKIDVLEIFAGPGRGWVMVMSAVAGLVSESCIIDRGPRWRVTPAARISP